MKDTKTNSNQIFNRPLRRTTFLGPMIGKLPKSGGSKGPTTYTKSVIRDDQTNTVTVTNVENGVQTPPYTINLNKLSIKHVAAGASAADNPPISVLGDNFTAFHTTELDFFTLWYKFNDNRVRVMTEYNNIRYFDGDPDSSKFNHGEFAYFSNGILSIKNDNGFGTGTHDFYSKSIIDNKVDELKADLLKDKFANYVKFTANENSSIEVIKNGTISVDLQYSFDGVQWEVYTSYTRTLNVERGQTVLFKGNNPTGFNSSHDDYVRFNLTGDISISGNIMGLLDNGTGTTTEIPNDYCFYALFYQSYGLVHVSENFLPATTLKINCYESMFNECINLKTAPNLPATELVASCYWGMFFKCAKLEKAPELPALTLKQDCYRGMFYGNTSLRIAPKLPATTLAEGCYQSIFSGCNLLFSVKIAYTGNFGDTTNAFTTWLANTPSYGIIYYNGSDTTTGHSAIPTGWQKVTF